MQQVAEKDRFRHIFYGCPPSADAIRPYPISAWFRRPSWESTSLDFSQQPRRWAGLRPGGSGQENRCVVRHILGVLAQDGRDKVTIIPSPGIYDLGAWLEQLLAESTGKVGKG
jgi:hypothetical protein